MAVPEQLSAESLVKEAYMYSLNVCVYALCMVDGKGPLLSGSKGSTALKSSGKMKQLTYHDQLGSMLLCICFPFLPRYPFLSLFILEIGMPKKY